MKRTILTAALIFSLTTAPAMAGGFGGSSSSSSSSRSSSSSSGSKASGSSGKCCSSSSKTSSSSKSNGASKPTAKAPSTGSKPSKPLARTIPKTAPPAPRVVNGRTVAPRVSVPSGRNYYRDRTYIMSHPSYGDPYGRGYYGSYHYGADNLYFYLWLNAMMSGDRRDRPAPPESDSKVSDALLSFIQIIKQEQAITAAKE